MNLSEIQQKLKAPKGQTNKFGNYKYRSCEDILEAVKPLLNGSTLTLSDKIIQLGDRYYIEATATLSNGKDSISVTAQAREQETRKGMDESQLTGTASSYARKYALNGLFCIDDTQDADTMEAPKPTPKKLPALTPKHESWPKAKEAIEKGTYSIETIKKKYSLTPVNEKMLCNHLK